MKTEIKFDWLTLGLVLSIILFHGEPDIVDAIVFKLTGVWQTSSGLLGLSQ